MLKTGRKLTDYSMNIICIPRGPFASNMYLVSFADCVFVIDPSVDPDSLEQELPSVTGILITHGHYDHIKYVEAWHEKYPETPIYMNPEDTDLISDSRANCSYMDGVFKTFSFPYESAAEILVFDDMLVEVIKTPGHTKGSVCYRFSEGGSDYLFTGDTLFAGSIGRTDFPGGSYDEILISLRRISELKAETNIYPGHGPGSTLGHEQKYNPFLSV